MKDLRVAVVGCGRMGTLRASAASALGADVRAVVDLDLSRARELAAKHAGCEAFQHWEQLQWSGLDAAFICTPPAHRGDVCQAAIRHGVDLLIEKPIGLSTRDCTTTLELAQTEDVLVAVGYMNRYRTSVNYVRKQLEERSPLGFIGHWVCKQYLVPWWSQVELSGGPINEQATHMVDLARYLVGEIVSVEALAPRHAALAPYGAVTTLEFENGIVGSFLYSCAANTKDIGLRVLTADGALELAGWEFQLRAAPNPAHSLGDPGAEDVFITETRAFIDAVRSDNGSMVRSDLADALRTQAAVDAIQQSLKTGGRVDVAAPLRRKDLQHVG